MYRDDQEALQFRLDGASREAERLRRENESMRAAVGRLQLAAPGGMMALPPSTVYSLVDVHTLPLEERARLAAHAVQPFPVWLVGVLNVLTFGLFPLIHFGLLHDRLPRAANNDPSAGKAIGFQFIPYYGLYWIFFSSLRLCDRLTLQLRLRGLTERAPRAMMLTACIFTVIPYVNLIAIPLLWTITVCLLQSTVNRVAQLSPTAWDASGMPAIPSPEYTGNAGHAAPTTPEQLAQRARAQQLVNWSHLLGWGGLIVLAIGTTIAGLAAGATLAAAVATVSGICVVVGAIVGQIGRGLQGRAI